MGHWSEQLLPGLKAKLGIEGDAEDETLLQMARKAADEIELFAGRSFDWRGEVAVTINSELPFLEIPDLNGQPPALSELGWVVPDPIHPELSTTFQRGPLPPPDVHAVSRAEALEHAGGFVVEAIGRGALHGAIWRWFRERQAADPTGQTLDTLLDPDTHVIVRVGTLRIPGWWIQISRRIQFITLDSPRYPRLREDLGMFGELRLVASEPIVLVARMTEQPVRWAVSFRIWFQPETAKSGLWRRGLAKSTHTHGIPVISVDGAMTREEASALILLTAHWHGYLEGDASAIPAALLRAYPKAVAAVRRGTDAPDDEGAAALLFERFLNPGIDPSRSAETVRRYVRRHASTIVLAHKTERAEHHPWDEFGVSERYYYRLLKRFASKALDGRYKVDDQVNEAIRTYRRDRERRADTVELLVKRGFSKAAARKGLQRHPLDWVRTARPRRSDKAE